jgi:hypothetical protein
MGACSRQLNTSPWVHQSMHPTRRAVCQTFEDNPGRVEGRWGEDMIPFPSLPGFWGGLLYCEK